MEVASAAFRYFYQFMDSFSYLVLAALGLSIIFGMMGIINQAHGEFIMLGAYAFTIPASIGVPYIICIIIAVLFVALFGLVIDRLIICRLYSRPLDSVVVTWGISLVITQGIRIIFGSTLGSVPVPFGSAVIGNETYSVYRLVLMGVSILILILFYLFFMHTGFGLRSRATMQNSEVARALGVNTNFTYSVTFMIGSALAGLCGALYAPLINVTPDMGQQYIIQAFTTVVVGGGNPLVGTVISGSFLGLVNGVLAMRISQFAGRIGMLVAAIIFIRVMPQGFSGLVEKGRIRRKINAKR